MQNTKYVFSPRGHIIMAGTIFSIFNFLIILILLIFSAPLPWMLYMWDNLKLTGLFCRNALQKEHKNKDVLQQSPAKRGRGSISNCPGSFAKEPYEHRALCQKDSWQFLGHHCALHTYIIVFCVHTSLCSAYISKAAYMLHKGYFSLMNIFTSIPVYLYISIYIYIYICMFTYI